ncbi:MAG: peptidyl-tRNA hydrolase [Candidatus Hydrogenedentota bacterium]
MKLLVGLGNPGPQYRNTRHNVGFRVVDRLADRLGAGFDREKHQALWASARVDGEEIVLVKPMTYMNRSGIAVAAAARNRVQDFAADFLVIVDDVNLPLGRLRFRAEGAAGGHNGLKSVAEQLGTTAYARLRLGVDAKRPGNDLADHVLSSFMPEEAPEVDRMVAWAVEGVLTFVRRGIAQAMNEFNGAPPATPE